jgi:hypothetical protein
MRRTWTPAGHTPVICHRFKWQRASMAAGLCFGSRGGGAAVAFHHQVGAGDTTTLIGVLEQLRRFLGGQKATLVWGRAARPAQQGDARLPWSPAVLAGGGAAAYARELNPVEPLWASLKGIELVNLAGEGLDEVIATAERGGRQPPPRCRRTPSAAPPGAGRQPLASIAHS